MYGDVYFIHCGLIHSLSQRCHCSSRSGVCLFPLANLRRISGLDVWFHVAIYTPHHHQQLYLFDSDILILPLSNWICTVGLQPWHWSQSCTRRNCCWLSVCKLLRAEVEPTPVCSTHQMAQTISTVNKYRQVSKCTFVSSRIRKNTSIETLTTGKQVGFHFSESVETGLAKQLDCADC